MPRLNLDRFDQWADKAARDVQLATTRGRALAAARKRREWLATLTEAEVCELVLNVPAKN